MHKKDSGSSLERMMERALYASRWILAPIYFGMSLILIMLTIKFFQEVFHVFPQIMEIKESQLILTALSLVDLILVGSLLVIVMFSGYENFVSQLSLTEDTEKLDWLGKHDYGSLKLKVASSVVAISSIHLLKVFMNVEHTNNEKIIWYVIIHLTLVISALFMGYLEKIAKSS
jgi:uncharacterized protein (TIGR00645 family)